MEELTVSVSAAIVHLLITCIPWLMGITLGGGLGALLGFGVRALFSGRPSLRRVSILLPWRTLVMGLLILVWSPFIPRLLWLGPITAGVMIAGSVSILVMTFMAGTLHEHWYPSPLAGRLLAGIRTLAVASGPIAAGVSLLAGGGLGQIILEAARLAQYGVMWKGLLVVISLSMVLDLMLGLAQMLALRYHGDSGRPASVKAMAA